MLPLLLAVVAVDCQTYAPSSARLPLLTTARQIHTLSFQQASLAYPVHLRGVVTFYDPFQEGIPALFIADASGSVFISMKHGPSLPLRMGTVAEVSGVTDPGGFAPVVLHPRLRISGQSRPLPQPRRVTLPLLLTGILDGQWVEIEALVHSAETEGMHVVLTLGTGDGAITATMVKENRANYAALVGSKVLIRGVAAPLVDSKRQLLGMRLLCPGLAAIAVEKTGPVDPFRLPPIPLGSLLQYSPVKQLQQQVHVQGRVTLHWPGRTLCILDGKDGICVQTADRHTLQEGELVDVLGFPERDNYEPTLADATLRPAGGSLVAPPNRITAEEALRGDHNGELVQIEARLIGKSLIMGDSTLLISSGKILFPAVLPAESAHPEKALDAAWVDGSTVRITGVFSGKVDAREITRNRGISRLESFQILLRSPSDVAVLDTPSWWSSRHTLMVLGLVATLTLAVLVWVVLLRRQVDWQTQIIRRSEEKFRHLAEHDALTGLAARTVLLERLDLALEKARIDRTPLALLMMDLDNFKQINDTLGHDAGDEVLRIAAKRVQASLRVTDTIARMGGDEFLALLPGVRAIEGGRNIASQLIANLAAPILIGGREVNISVSIGITAYPGDGEGATLLLRNADLAMYRAKALGRNGYQFFSPHLAPAGGLAP